MTDDIPVEVSMHIAAQPETVFPYFTDPSRCATTTCPMTSKAHTTARGGSATSPGSASGSAAAIPARTPTLAGGWPAVAKAKPPR